MTMVARLPGNGGYDAVVFEVEDGAGFLAFRHRYQPLTHHLHREGLDDVFDISVPAVPTSRDHLIELRDGFRAWLDYCASFTWPEKTEAGVRFELGLAPRADGLIVDPGKAAFTWSITNGASLHAQRSFVVGPSCVRFLLEDFVVA